MKPLMAEATERFVERYAAAVPHALLLSGPSGIGLATLAHWIAQRNGSVTAFVAPEKPSGSTVLSISTERVRDLYKTTRTSSKNPRYVIIDDADRMNHVAQNSLLKLLEEPNDSTKFILTSHKPELLLPTIMSRLQWFAVPKVDTISSRRLIKSLGVSDERRLSQLLYIADGLPATLHRLSKDEATFSSLVDSVSSARAFIEGSRYDRLVIINGLKDDRAAALGFIDTVVLLFEKITRTRPDKATYQQIERLLRAYGQIEANGNVRLQLAHAVVY